jgi:hypothetical protein
MTGRTEKTVFISYRRTNLPWALAVYQDLTSHGWDVFFDYLSIPSGDFEKIIIENIRGRAHFVVILTPSSLDHCHEPGDWLRREIETAMDERRNVVPLMLESFDFGNPTIVHVLTGKLENLKKYNGLRVPSEYFFEAMQRLREQFLNVLLEAVIHPISEQTRQITEEHQVAANQADQVEQRELSAQEFVERGFFANNPDDAIRYNTEAIRLKSDYTIAYYNRGCAFLTKGDNISALADFQRASELEPDIGSYRIPIVKILKSLGRLEEMRQQEQIARALIQNDDHEYDQARLEAICGNVDKAIDFLKQALEQGHPSKRFMAHDPELENIRHDPRFKELVDE